MNLLLINNVASFNSILCNELNTIDGINAQYITFSKSKYISENEHGTYFPFFPYSRRNPIKLIKHYLLRHKVFKKIRQADVVYYLVDSIFDEIDLKYASKKKKSIFVEWIGSEIRDPEIIKKLNPFYSKILGCGYEYEEQEQSNLKNEIQNRFYKYNAVVFACPEMKLFINTSLFPTIVNNMQRLDISTFHAEYPALNKKTPLIVHSPSAPIAKGTEYILKAVNELKKDYNFEFKLLHNMKREEVLLITQKADIFIDQLILGSYGMASCEAMAYGKPVLCHIMPELFDSGLPKECPIINTTPENLKENIIQFLNDPNLRYQTGVKSRLYIEKYHDVKIVAHNMLSIFKQKLN